MTTADEVARAIEAEIGPVAYLRRMIVCSAFGWPDDATLADAVRRFDTMAAELAAAKGADAKDAAQVPSGHCPECQMSVGSGHLSGCLFEGDDAALTAKESP